MEKSNSKSTELSKPERINEDLAEEVFEDSDKLTFLSDTSLVPLTISEQRLDFVDQRIISPKFYNNFNFSKLSKRYNELNVTLGITSANKGEGKTLVATNMGVSLAQAYRQRTVLVDLNFKNPQLHSIFGAPMGPGLVEAMETRMLRVNPTMVDDLYLLSAGECSSYKPGIKDTIALREILYTLKSEFDFIIVDMGPVFPFEEFPVHFINEVDGLLTVVDTQNTRKEHLKKIFKHVDENRFVGYIFNKMEHK